MNIIELHNALMNNRDANGNLNVLGAYLGYDIQTGKPVYESVRNAVALIGPAGSGKSTRIISQSIATFPGLVVATTCRGINSKHPDVIEITKRARWKIAEITGGQVVELGVDETLEPFVKRVSWNFIADCVEWSIASSRARQMAFAKISDKDGISHQSHFIDSVEKILAPILLFTAVAGFDVKKLKKYILDKNNKELTDSLEIMLIKLKERGLVEAAQQLNIALRMESRNRIHVFSQLREVVNSIPTFENQVVTIDELLRGHSTIYIQASPNPSEARRVSPVIATFIQSLADRYKSLSYDSRPTSMLLALDEVLNVAPLENLPNIMNTFGGDNIQTMIAIQNVVGLENKWPNKGILQSCTQVLFPGISGDDYDYLNRLSKFSGERLAEDSSLELPLDTKGIPTELIEGYILEKERIIQEGSINVDYLQKQLDFRMKKVVRQYYVRWEEFMSIVSKIKRHRNARYIPNYTIEQLSNFEENCVILFKKGKFRKHRVPNYYDVPFWNDTIFQMEK